MVLTNLAFLRDTNVRPEEDEDVPVLRVLRVLPVRGIGKQSDALLTTCDK